MQRKIRILSLSFLFIFITLIFAQAQTGKIVGKVTDKETGEALIGATVLIEGTSIGASTDLEGEFIILNVPPGTYNLKTTFIGYRAVTLTNIKVAVNLTTDLKFQLSTEAIQEKEVIVIAERLLINKNITNATSVVTTEDIENLPIRGVNAIVSTQAGVVEQGGNLYVRGSRADAVAYYVDGVLVNNPVFGGSRTSVIQNAIEEIQFQAGGYTAEFGGANAGIISTQTRTGKENYSISLEAITDNFAKVGEKYLGGYSTNYSEYILTAGGPILPNFKKIRFFLAANNVFSRSPARFYKGFDFPGIYDPGLAASGRADTLNFKYPTGYLPGYFDNAYQIQGNLTWDLNPVSLRFNSNYRNTQGRNGVGYTGIFTESRTGLNQSETFTSNFKFSHVLHKNSFYEVILNYFGDFYVDMDPFFKHDITKYGDKLENEKFGTILSSDGVNLTPYYAYGFSFTRSTVPFNAYRKQRTNSIGVKTNLVYQYGSHHELKVGAEFNSFTIRRYSIGPMAIASNINANPEGDYYRIYRRVDNYGYDVFGNKTEKGLEKPRKPLFGGLYIQDKIEYSDLVINAGLRFDYFDIDGHVFKDPTNIQFDRFDKIDQSGLEKVKPFGQLSPRLGFSFPVTDQTVFHAQYGKFIQQTRLRDVYQGYNVIADNVKGGYAISEPVGFGLKPERTTQYEIGFKQSIGDIFAFNITGFYKDIKDQIQIRTIYAVEGANHEAYYAWVNGDFSTVKGIEFKINLRRTNRLAASVDYTYSDAQGTGSNPSTGFRMIWVSPTATPFFPQQIAPLDFNQTHRGAVNIDFRYGNNDGPSIFGQQILQNLGANLLFSFNSGYNYTKWRSFGLNRIPLEPLNTSTTPWTFQLDGRLDKTFSFGGFKINMYLWVINVLNTENIVSVFNTTGDPYDNGYLTTPEGIAIVEGFRRFGEYHAQTYMDLYKALNYNAGFFGTPRQIRLGVRLTY